MHAQERIYTAPVHFCAVGIAVVNNGTYFSLIIEAFLHFT